MSGKMLKADSRISGSRATTSMAATMNDTWVGTRVPEASSDWMFLSQSCTLDG